MKQSTDFKVVPPDGGKVISLAGAMTVAPKYGLEIKLPTAE